MKVDTNFALVHRVQEALNRDWEVQVQHTYREGDAAADWRVNFDLSKHPLSREDLTINDPLKGL